MVSRGVVRVSRGVVGVDRGVTSPTIARGITSVTSNTNRGSWNGGLINLWRFTVKCSATDYHKVVSGECIIITIVIRPIGTATPLVTCNGRGFLLFR